MEIIMNIAMIAQVQVYIVPRTLGLRREGREISSPSQPTSLRAAQRRDHVRRRVK